MTLEHLGIAVRDAEAAVALFTALLGTGPYKEEVVDREGVRTVFFGDAGAAGRAPKLELLAVTDPASPVARFLERRGPGIHHVAFQVDDLVSALDRLRAAGFEVVSDTPTAGADGKCVAFLHPRTAGGVLVELVEARPAVERFDVRVDGGSIAVFAAGPRDAPAVVLLHGILGTSAGDTEPLARRLAADFRVLSVDHRGHGESTAGGELSIERLAEDLVAVLDEAGVERAHLFGYSLGAAVALYSAWRHTDRLGRVALYGTNVRWSDAEARAVTQQMREALDDPDGRMARSQAARHGDGRWRDLIQHSIAFTTGLQANQFPEDAMREIGTDVLVIHGDGDPFFDPAHALHLRRTLPSARLWIVPGAGHALQSVDQAALARAVGEFFR